MHALLRREGAVLIRAIELWPLAMASADALRNSTASRMRRRPLGIQALDPHHRDRKIDRRGETVKRDVALRAAHRGSDRLAHLGEVAPFSLAAPSHSCFPAQSKASHVQGRNAF